MEDKVGSFDVINGLFIVCSINVSLSGVYEGMTSNTMGGTITIPIPIESITTDIIDIAVIVILFTSLVTVNSKCPVNLTLGLLCSQL